MTEHPCAGMSEEAVAAFERIATGAPADCTWPVIDELEAKNVIARAAPEVRRDAMGVYHIVNFYVPIRIHMQWSAWCFEQGRARPPLAQSALVVPPLAEDNVLVCVIPPHSEL